MQGRTAFTFVTEGIEAALERSPTSGTASSTLSAELDDHTDRPALPVDEDV
jgi:hypothetical protein